MNYPGTLILTSDGLTTDRMIDAVKKSVKNLEEKKVAIVTTASKNKEKNPYSIRAKAQYEELGFKEVRFVDLETESDFDFSTFDILHVCGGNTFRLLHFARLSNFKDSVINLLARGGVFVGVSAGTIILSPSIKFVDDNHFDPNNIGMTDFTGFDIVPYNIFVHYNTGYESLLADYENKTGLQFERITNEQAMLITKKGMEII